MEKAILETHIKEFQLFSKGKVRDVYDLEDRLLIVATDRISAFDVVLPTGIPGKGK
ncbi:MAG TPA: phosphoribosylaminoimidazolesuccinocarboxamide synthase, partial [candidate division Zixibacteria bacterium]